MSDKEILLYSAGADSFPAWHYLGQPQALYFDVGHRYRDHEYRAIQSLRQKWGIDLVVSRELDLAAWEPGDGIIPLRNAYFAMLASHRANMIWCVGVKGDHTADKSPEAFARMSEFITELAGREVRVDSPFWNLTKTEIVAWYLSQGLPVEDLLETFSCLNPGTSLLHCGQCSACLRRWISFTNNGISAAFATNPWEWERVHTYYMAAMRDGTYPQHRAAEFFAALATVGVEIGG